MKNLYLYAFGVLGSALLVAVTAEDSQPLRAPAGYVAKQGTKAEPYSGSGYALEIVHGTTQLELVFIPAGEFDMGSQVTQFGRSANEGPVHKVQITRPFYMGKHEVSQTQWAQLMGPEHMQSSRFTKWIKNRVVGDGLPVVGITWQGAQEFAQKAGDGLRLPTEAEWEYACRADRTTAYYCHDDLSQLPEHAWYRDTARGKLHPVGSKLANPWGLHDMHGSVFEWCSDWLDDDYYMESPAADPQGPSSGRFHVVRGGSYLSSPIYCRAAFRHHGFGPLKGDNRLSDYGLRLVCSVE